MARRVLKKTKYKKPEECFFCSIGKQPGYKDFTVLKRFLTSRGKIISRWESGLCAKHQRRLATGVKRARNLALI
ncbi:30S ribosomal protein S18 [Patescibacteria group bacterium]|nr:30S ribosomal protein S18 [Patescibacteria group bacterium]MBU1868812.1 30S ribosomal protein S18 [Patescibacteria group bacterium]